MYDVPSVLNRFSLIITGDKPRYGLPSIHYCYSPPATSGTHATKGVHTTTRIHSLLCHSMVSFVLKCFLLD